MKMTVNGLFVTFAVSIFVSIGECSPRSQVNSMSIGSEHRQNVNSHVKVLDSGLVLPMSAESIKFKSVPIESFAQTNVSKTNRPIALINLQRKQISTSDKSDSALLQTKNTSQASEDSDDSTSDSDEEANGLASDFQTIHINIPKSDTNYLKLKYRESINPLTEMIFFTSIVNEVKKESEISKSEEDSEDKTDSSEKHDEPEIDILKNCTFGVSMTGMNGGHLNMNMIRVDNKHGWDDDRISVMWTSIRTDEWLLETGVVPLPDQMTSSWMKGCSNYKTSFPDLHSSPYVFTDIRPFPLNGSKIAKDDKKSIFFVTISGVTAQKFCYRIQKVGSKDDSSAWKSQFQLVYMAIPVDSKDVMPDGSLWGKVSFPVSETNLADKSSEKDRLVAHKKVTFSTPFEKTPRILINTAEEDGTDHNDVFAATVHSLNKEGFSLTLSRVDAKGWQQRPQVLWMAWKDEGNPVADEQADTAGEVMRVAEITDDSTAQELADEGNVKIIEPTEESSGAFVGSGASDLVGVIIGLSLAYCFNTGFMWNR
eukprot:GHVL01005118.1.p1 GENE.GHVL01005118.1~~GHVL01005118.1.p1  ORF type:complete len:538 (-),score=86.08 GHVL01005118.1:1532-3145(-)